MIKGSITIEDLTIEFTEAPGCGVHLRVEDTFTGELSVSTTNMVDLSAALALALHPDCEFEGANWEAAERVMEGMCNKLCRFIP